MFCNHCKNLKTMSVENKISVQMDPSSIERILAAIGVINAEMPFLQNLTTNERINLLKMGDKTVSFVNKALEYAKQNPQVVPSFLDVAEMEKDVVLINSLVKVLYPVQQIVEKMDDTTMLAGSEAYSAALVFYNAAKGAAKAGVPGMKTLVDDLSSRFPGRTSAASVAASAPKVN